MAQNKLVSKNPYCCVYSIYINILGDIILISDIILNVGLGGL